MTDRPSTPEELRMEANSVLDRLRRLESSVRDGGHLAIDAIDGLTDAISTFQGRIEETARHYNHAWALQDVLAARRAIDEARMIVMGFLTDLRDD
ncbi:hypothetical protein [Patulibacter minatonensis]|uniref:hypothetical protein n=1 Tax=Patulibacter minatonensis TaxID=298163 RepID=UPI00047E6DE5|nr:hypothetical protein [Patulibacter minatonensis]